MIPVYTNCVSSRFECYAGWAYSKVLKTKS